jgi:hypothetical protein
MSLLSKGDQLCIKAFVEIRRGTPKNAAKAFIALVRYVRECEEKNEPPKSS